MRLRESHRYQVMKENRKVFLQFKSILLDEKPQSHFTLL